MISGLIFKTAWFAADILILIAESILYSATVF